MTALRKHAWIVLLCAGAAGCGQKPAPARGTAPAPGHVETATRPPNASSAAATASAPSRRSTARARPEPAAPATPAPPTGGVLHINSDVPGASVFIDRQFVGVTPVTAPNVPPGTHQLNLSATGYSGIAQSVDVEPGPRDLLFTFKDVRLDAAIDVVHKHRLGSCKGRLVATPQGLRYETTDKNDAFSAPLTSLGLLEVDYLAKTLHVNVKGRQYDFTDPDGNADRLFVFHRDVDAARKKLSATP
jgi:hypothetical protein